MKKFLLPILALVFLIACEKENTSELETNEASYETSYENGSASERNPNKRDVCHNGNIINININAIPGHQAHGDAVDMDEDGYFDIDNPCSETDCDDTNPAIHPGAVEILCNDTDDDCNAATPDSIEEICDNGIDDDCDGDVDEADSDCSTSCLEGELEVTLPDGPLFVAPDREPNIYDWQGAKDACALKAAADGCDWYLPTLGELVAMYQQLGPAPNNNFENRYLWSSSGGGSHAWSLTFYNGHQYYEGTSFNGLHCRCVRR